MSKRSTPKPNQLVKPKAARKAPAKRGRTKRALDPDEQIFRDNPHDYDTPDYRRYIVAALYSRMEAHHREVPDYAAQVMQRYVDFELSIAEVVQRIDFGAQNLT